MIDIIPIIVLIALVLLAYYWFTKKKQAKLDAAVHKWASLPLHNYSQDFLKAKRLKQDAEADEIIKQIFSSGNPEDINTFYSMIQRTAVALPPSLPSYLKDFFAQGERLPEWADKTLIKKGQEFYIEHGAMIAMVLCAKSLPECYACANGAMVLAKTGRLSEQNGSLNAFTRRIAETAQFIVNVMSPRGLSPVGTGIRSAQKVRLIHASIRYYIHKSGWNSDQYGAPINQEDMAGTLMSFAPLVLEGLETLGISITPQEKEAYFHCWRVVGHFMGLDEDLLPNNVADAFALGYGIFDTEKKASEQGVMLTKSLIDFMTMMSPKGEINLIVDDLLRMMIGDETADMLGIPKPMQKDPKLFEHAEGQFLAGWDVFKDRHTILRKLSGPINKILLNGMLVFMNKGDKINFFIPPSLQDSWGLTNNKTN